MIPPPSFIASYTGLQTLVTARGGKIYPLAPQMFPREQWRERSGNIELEYDGLNLTARLIMDDGNFSAITLDNIPPEKAKLAIQQKTLLLRYVSQDVKFTGEAKKITKKSKIKLQRPKSNSHLEETTETTIPRETTLYSLKLQGLLIDNNLYHYSSSQTPIGYDELPVQNPPEPANQIKNPPQKYGSLQGRSFSSLTEKNKQRAASPSVILHNPTDTFLNHVHQYDLLDHESEIILGKRKEVEAARMQKALCETIFLQFPYNSALRQFFQNIRTVLQPPDKPATREIESHYYAAIRTFFPFDKEIASQLIDQYTASLEELLNSKSQENRKSAFTSLPWKEEPLTKILNLCQDYASDFLHTTSEKPLFNDQQKNQHKKKPHDITQSQQWLELHAKAQQQYTEVISTVTVKNARLIMNQLLYYVKKGYERSDLVQYGMLGLRKAAIKYDWQRGYKFSTYALWWIRQEIQRSTQEEGSLIRMPVHMHDTKNKIKRAQSKLYNEYQREPSAQEIADDVKMPLTKVEFILRQYDHLCSLDEKVGESQESSLLDFVDGSDQAQLEGHAHVPLSPETASKKNQEEQRVQRALKKLHPREEKVLHLRFGIGGKEELTLEEVGQKFNLTRERIRQIETGALKKIARNLWDIDSNLRYTPSKRKNKKQQPTEAENESEKESA